MEKAQIRTVATFFFFTLMDKNMVYAATTETLKILTKKQRKNLSRPLANTVLISTTYEVWNKYRNQKPRLNWEIQDLHIPFEIPQNLNLSPWRQFMKDEHPNLSLVLVWSRILGFTEKDISEGMGVSQGTVRYRTGKALKDLATELGSPGVGNA